MTEKSRAELYQELKKERTTLKYTNAEEKYQKRRIEAIWKSKDKKNAAFENFKNELRKWDFAISFLDEEMAKKLLHHKRRERPLFLHLSKLRELTPEAAKVLADANPQIYLPWNAIKDNPRILKNLMQNNSDTMFLNVGTLSEKMANIYQEAKWTLSFREITAISPTAAQSLARCKTPVYISIKGNPDLTQVLEIFATSSSAIKLYPEKYQQQFEYIKQS